MKKRILSVVLAFVMMTVSMTTVFAASLDISGTADEVYEGNKPFILAEGLLDELNDDAKADIFDKDTHEYQLRKISSTSSKVRRINADDLADAINHLTSNLSDAQKMYLYAQVKAESDAAFKAALDAVDPVGDLPLRESFGLLDNYVQDMRVFLNANNISAADYDNDAVVKEQAKEIVAEPLIAILKVMFAEDGYYKNIADYDRSVEYMRENYINEFIANDRAKKTLSVLFGAELTKEIVTDSFLPGVGNNTPGKIEGIVHHVKKYLSDNASALADVKSDIENGVLVSNAEDSVDGAFDALGKLVVAAYESDALASDSLKNSVKMLMGDGNNNGLVELMIKAVDDPAYRASNTWINLFISEFVQTVITGGDTLYTISAKTPNPAAAKIENDTYVTFKNKNLSDFGIDDDMISLRTGKFTIKFYVKDPASRNNELSLMESNKTPSSSGGSGGGGGGGSSKPTETPYQEPDYESYVESDYVTCDEQGRITVKYDAKQAEEYAAYMVLSRSNRAYNETFVESYPVTILNKYYNTGSSGSRPNLNKEHIHYDTNGGNEIGSVPYLKGEKVDLTVVPVRDGYKFTGWYLDEALTQRVESITVDGEITLYAGWVKDGSSVVSKVDVPEQLNGEEHYAYVIGYPEGDVRPYGNITRAETVTILFRLLKDDVRTANITTENVFVDVSESDWFNQAVSTLAAMNIVNGRTETEFMPNAYITRAEFATIFARFAEYSYNAEDVFNDINGHWAEDYINEAAAYGWIAGYEDDSFRPENLITRAESMTLINRVLKRVPETTEDLLSGMSVWTDNTDTSMWYYIAVQEATNSHKFTMKNSSNEKWTELTENKDWTVYEK